MARSTILRINTDSIGIKKFIKLLLLSIEYLSKAASIPIRKMSNIDS